MRSSTLLPVLLSGLLAGFLMVDQASAQVCNPSATPPCPGNRKTCCKDTFAATFSCKNLATADDNCSACGIQCPIAGASPDARRCCGITTLGGPNCVDTHTDLVNCGGCGNRCQAGNVCTASICTPCDAGSFRPLAAATCAPCPPGSFSGPGSAVCTECPSGSVSDAGSSTCHACTPGTFESAADTCGQCPAGTFSGASATTCTTCPAGSISGVGSSSCTACAAGTYQSAVDTCSDCADGWVSHPSASACTQCPAGTYQFSVDTCNPCPAGTSSPAGSISASACVGNTYLPTGVVNNVPITSLSGWTQCFAQTYNIALTESMLQGLATTCGGSKILVGCAPTGATYLQVAAWGAHSTVFQANSISTSAAVADPLSGAFFYRIPNYSFGFAPSAQVYLNECDVQSVENNQRVCRHTIFNSGGWRCGSDINLNNDATFTFYLYSAP